MLLLCLFPKEGLPDALVLLSGLFPFDVFLSSALSDLPNLCPQEHMHMPMCTHAPTPTPTHTHILFFLRFFFFNVNHF